MRAGSAAGKFRVFDFSASISRPYTFWAGVIGGVALTLSTFMEGYRGTSVAALGVALAVAGNVIALYPFRRKKPA